MPEKLMQGLNITYNAGVSPPNAAIAAVTPHDSCAATHSLASCDVDRGLTQPTAAVGSVTSACLTMPGSRLT